MDLFLLLTSIGIMGHSWGYYVILVGVLLKYIIDGRGIPVEFVKHFTIYCMLIFGLTYSVGYSNRYEASIAGSFFISFLEPVAAFLFGYLYIRINNNDVEASSRRIISIISLGCSIHALINIGININRPRYDLIDFFGETTNAVATNMSGVNTLIFSLFPAIVMLKNRRQKYFGIVAFLISLIYSAILGTRSIYIVLILSIVMYWFYNNLNKGLIRNMVKIDSRRFKQNISIIIVLLILIVVNIRTLIARIATSNLLQRFNLDNRNDTNLSDKFRILQLAEALGNLFKYPFGNNYSRGYVHNYWLDIGQTSGIIPVIAIVILDIILLRHIIEIKRSCIVNNNLSLAYICMALGFYTNFFFEPIMEGYRDLLSRSFVIFGMTESIYICANKGRKNGFK